MKKNILILTGSPRRYGNSDLMADALREGALEAGHTVDKVETAYKHIQGCKACNACFSHGKACVYDDDFSNIVPLLEKADVLAFTTPVYWFSFPAQLKACIDKMYAFLVGNRPLTIKEAVLLACAEDDETAFEGLTASYRHICAYCQWSDRGTLLIPSMKDKGDVKKTDALGRAKELGRAL